MRRISIILGMLALIVCAALIFRAAGQFVDNQAELMKERTQIAR